MRTLCLSSERKICWNKTRRIWFLCTCTLCLMNAGLLFKIFSVRHCIPRLSIDTHAATLMSWSVEICHRIILRSLTDFHYALFNEGHVTTAPQSFLHKFAFETYSSDVFSAFVMAAANYDDYPSPGTCKTHKHVKENQTHGWWTWRG